MNHSWLYPRVEDHDAAAEHLFSVDSELTIAGVMSSGDDASFVSTGQTVAVGRRRHQLS